MAAGAYPLLGVRPRLHLAAGDADVFSRRSAVRIRSDLQFGAGREGADADGLELRPGKHPAGMGAVLPLQHRAARAQCHADGDQIVQETIKETTKGITPSQTVGPFFKYGLTPGGKYAWNDAFTNDLITPDASGERIRIAGRVFDGDGAPVPDAMLEIWQADVQGRFADRQDKRAGPNTAFRGFGRCGTDANGEYAFDTIKPGGVPEAEGKPQAPHILLAILARGMLLHLYTRIYFDGEAANSADPVLALVPADRRATLIAGPKTGASGTYVLDIHLQGDKETVFFEV